MLEKRLISFAAIANSQHKKVQNGYERKKKIILYMNKRNRKSIKLKLEKEFEWNKNNSDWNNSRKRFPREIPT